MPTVIVLDVSLSMCRPVPVPDSTEEFQRKNLAIHGINSFLDYMSLHCKLEFTSLIVFSYLWEQLVTFTRDFDSIKSALNKVETYNKTCIEAALTGVSSIITDEWNSVTPSQVILITDGSVGYGQKSLKHSLETWDQRDPTVIEDKFPLPFRFPSNLHVVVVGNPNDADVKTAIPLYEKLIEINGQGGELFLPDSNLSLKSVQTMFMRLAEKYYKPYTGALKCGHFKCPIQLFPPPEKYDNLHEFDHIKKEVSSSLEVMGFIEIGDAASPQTLSRHLVLPLPSKDSKVSSDSSEKKEKEEEDETSVDEGKTPAFTVLLHGSLKVEGMVALTKLAEDWYGILYSWADSKKKSNLMLSILQPGPEPISWLGNIHNLAPISDFIEPPYGEDDNKTPFPIRPQDKRSYAQSCVVWIKPMGLQTDIQKVLRHARKLPDKLQQFYKELNRLRRAALSFGFHELLGAMATMLERECRMLPGTAHPDATLQLTHAANALRGDKATDIDQPVSPLITNFQQQSQENP
ncbi:hypothetical protein FSP39_025008 [Pinctada imbricata]|uniref:Integrator complex subunit 14 n=1 Tax=Pinctada imbricata TaxID=66713 RepID=A0AA88Y6G7_PINIB|nr:hypothetical protein FSP39_025008 [Pinctada imbricata]